MCIYIYIFFFSFGLNFVILIDLQEVLGTIDLRYLLFLLKISSSISWLAFYYFTGVFWATEVCNSIIN